VAPSATPFFSSTGFQHHIYKLALHKIRRCRVRRCRGETLGFRYVRLLGAQALRKAVGVCRPSSTCTMKAPWHHSPSEPSGVGEGP
jgi:hypothetical protein